MTILQKSGSKPETLLNKIYDLGLEREDEDKAHGTRLSSSFKLPIELPSFEDLTLDVQQAFAEVFHSKDCMYRKQRLGFPNGSVVEAFPNKPDTIRGNKFDRKTLQKQRGFIKATKYQHGESLLDHYFRKPASQNCWVHR